MHEKMNIHDSLETRNLIDFFNYKCFWRNLVWLCTTIEIFKILRVSLDSIFDFFFFIQLRRSSYGSSRWNIGYKPTKCLE